MDRLLLLALVLSSSSAYALTGKEVFSKVRPLIFQIKTSATAESSKNSYGTGFVIRKEGALLTNFHVVSDSVMEPERYHAYLVDGDKSLPVTVMHVDAVNDVALLKVERSFPGEIPFAPEMPRQGERIYSVGLPEDLNMSIVEGVYNGIVQDGPYAKIHMSSPINAGMSGGPTLDAAGRLVGINVSKLYLSNNVSFAVPLERVKKTSGIRERGGNKGKVPSALELEALIREQLREASSSLSREILAMEAVKKNFGMWKVGDLPKDIHCWGQNSDPKQHKKYKINAESCSLQNNVFLDSRNYSGEFSLTSTGMEGISLNPLQSMDLVDWQMRSGGMPYKLRAHFVHDVMPELTAPECFSRKIANKHGVPMLVHVCVSEYSRYENLFSANIDIATLYTGKHNLHLDSHMSGFTFEDVKALAAHFADSIEYTGPKND